MINTLLYQTTSINQSTFDGCIDTKGFDTKVVYQPNVLLSYIPMIYLNLPLMVVYFFGSPSNVLPSDWLPRLPPPQVYQEINGQVCGAEKWHADTDGW